MQKTGQSKIPQVLGTLNVQGMHRRFSQQEALITEKTCVTSVMPLVVADDAKASGRTEHGVHVPLRADITRFHTY